MGNKIAVLFVGILIASTLLGSPPTASAFTHVSSLALNSNEQFLESAVIDPSGGYAYFGTFTEPGTVVKVRLSDFTRLGALTLNSGEGDLSSAIIDQINGYAYFGTTYSVPNIIVKIRLSNFTRVGALTLNSGEGPISSAVIDPVGGYAYFGTYTFPGVVVKIRLSNFTRVSALTMMSGENELYSAVIDATAGYAYFGTNTFPSTVVELQLATAPSLPSTPNATPGPGKVLLSWVIPYNGDHPITSYKLYRSTTPGGELGTGSTVTNLGNVTSYTDTPLTPGTTYYYKLSAINSIGESPLSGEVSGTPTGSAASLPLPYLTLALLTFSTLAVRASLRKTQLKRKD